MYRSFFNKQIIFCKIIKIHFFMKVFVEIVKFYPNANRTNSAVFFTLVFFKILAR